MPGGPGESVMEDIGPARNPSEYTPTEKGMRCESRTDNGLGPADRIGVVDCLVGNTAFFIVTRTRGHFESSKIGVTVEDTVSP